MNRVLFTGFKGKTNSSKLVLDNILDGDKLYLTNSFNTSVKELYKEINKYDYIISLGQSDIKSDNIKIEKYGSNLETDFDIDELYNYLFYYYYKVTISNNAGNHLCNNIYYYGLKKIYEENLNTKMVFIHIPKIKNISDIEKLSRIIENIIEIL